MSIAQELFFKCLKCKSTTFLYNKRPVHSITIRMTTRRVTMRSGACKGNQLAGDGGRAGPGPARELGGFGSQGLVSGQNVALMAG